MSLFAQFKRQLRDLQSPRTLHELHNIAGAATHEYVMDGFARQQDPYGRPWAPTKRQNPILQDSLALRDGIKWKADSRGVVIQTTGKANKYAAYHQHGTRPSTRYQRKNGRFLSAKRASKSKRMVYLVSIPGLPARPFLPEQGIMPPQLAVKIENDFRQYFRSRYGGP